jgi:hypothetical protein
MRALILFCTAFILLSISSCTSIPRGTAEERQELADLCDTFLAHYCAGRLDEVEAIFAPNALVAIDRVDKDEQVVLTAAQFLEKTRANLAQGSKFVERIVGEPIVLIDHKVATVWAIYEIESEAGQMEGFDVFQWIRLDEAWRLVSLSYTNRRHTRSGAR